MASFISRVVADLLKKDRNISNTTFVLPSQRACVYLKDALKRSLQGTSFLPEILSIENYIQQVADMVLIDNVQLLFEFYEVYTQSVKKENLQSFETFTQWAVIVLHDFNEVDSYLVKTRDFFSDLKDIKRLNAWFDKKRPSQLAVDYLEFFEQLHELYTRLYDTLKSKKVGYQGLIYREAHENLEYYIQNNAGKKIVFIGFNALNKSEEMLFQELLDQEMATIYWDCNTEMMNTEHESGLFLRHYKKHWNYYKNHPFSWIDEAPDYSSKNIHIIGAPKNTTQLKVAGELLSKFETFENSACVLADEKVLPLMLNALPENVNRINITMGNPLNEVPVALLFDKIISLHLNQQKFGDETSQKFYYKDVLSLLNDPTLVSFKELQMTELNNQLLKHNRLFLSVGDLKAYAGTENLSDLVLFFSLFKPAKHCDEILFRCLHVIDELKETAEGISREYLFRLNSILQQLLTLNGKYKHIKNLKVLRALYRQLLKIEKLSFRGEPLVGLQLMGMLETRALDFDNLIITSVNEGILPSGRKDYSFIPFDARMHYGLPTYHDKDAIFSYHFHRLLHRVKKCYLIYNTEMDGFGSGENSRFLTMLKIKNPGIVERIVSPGINLKTAPEIRVEKTPELMTQIKAVLTKGVSPSALTTYIANPIRFYEQKILGVKSKKEIEETVEMNTMGSIIHEALEILYKPFEGKYLNKTAIKQMTARVDEVLIKSFETQYLKGSVRKGKNRLVFEVCKKYIQNFLSIEKRLLHKGDNVKIIALEEKLELEFKPDGFDFPVKIHGIVDRIEKRNGVLRIIDYKTGSVKQEFLTVIEPEKYIANYDYSKAFQLMMYASLFVNEKGKPPKEPMVAGLISFKSLNRGFLQLKFSRSRSAENFIETAQVSTFMETTEKLLKEIYNPDIAFVENADAPF